MGFAPLVGLAFVAVIAAVIFSLLALFRSSKRAQTLSSVLPALALLFLLIQLLIGFPAKKDLAESMSEDSAETESSDEPFAQMGESMAVAMMMNIQVKTKPVFYFELLALGIPTLLLANSLIDKHKSGARPAEGPNPEESNSV
jgi:energy-coupling factor transporter transmembrane protein EcfT